MAYSNYSSPRKSVTVRKIGKEEQSQSGASEFYHNLFLAMQKPKVPCDICSQEFENEELLQLHKMFDHEVNLFRKT